MIKKTLLSIIKWGTYLCLLVPLIFKNGFLYSFIIPKTIYFRVIVEIIFAAYLVLILSFPEYRPKINALSISVTIFILSLIVASVLGVDFQRSFWSTFERETGLFTLLHLYVFFIVLSNVFKDRKDWQRFFLISIAVGVICCLTVIPADADARGGGAIGNSSFLASYLLFDIFFAIAFLAENKLSGLRIFSIISLLVFLTILLSIGARGAAVSFFGGLILFFMGSLFFSGKKKLAIITPLVLILIAGVLIFAFPTIQNIIVSNLREIRARLIVWEIAWKGFLERPVLGWGLENFNAVFAKYFNPKLFLKEYGGEIWFDRAHNIVLDMLINSGIVGLVAYLSIFSVSIFFLFKKCFSENKERAGVNLAIICLFIAYFVQNLLVFDSISSYVIFFLTLSFVGFLIQEESFERNNNFVISGFFRNLCYFLIFIFMSACFYFGNIQPANSARNTAKMVSADNFEEKIEFYQKSLEGFRYSCETNKRLGSSLVVGTITLKEDKEVLQRAIDLVKKEALNDLQNNSFNLRLYIVLAKIYISNYRITRNYYHLYSAENVLEEAIELSPKNQQLYWLLSDVKYKQGDFDSNVRLLKKAIDLEPRWNNSYWYLVSTYLMEERYEEALEVIKEGEKKGLNWRKNLNGFKNVVSVYESLKDYETLCPIYKEMLASYPDDADSWFKFAVCLFNIEDKEGAKEAAQKAIQINPELMNQPSDILKALLQ